MSSITLIGSGGAGLAFLHHFASSAIRHWPLTVIDPNPQSAHSKTWCYWSEPGELSQLTPDFSWTDFMVSGATDATICELNRYRYHCVGGASFHRMVMNQLKSLPNVRFIHEKAESISWNPQNTTVEVALSNTEVVSSVYCFTSAPHESPEKLQQDRAYSPFLQQFAGGIVAFDKPVFDADTLTLMDFKVDQHPGSVHFAYVLPHDANKALIEITAFTPELYSEAHFHKAFILYVERIASTKNCGYRLLEPEQGVIPMHIGHHARKLNPHTFTLGTQSGMVKPSTGYAFFAMHQQARFYINELTAGGGTLRAYPAVHGRFRFYDALLLDILRVDPHQTISIFQTLFRNVNTDRVMEFLRESSSLPYEMLMFSKLPKKPFLKALWRHVFS